ncbi:hypothetical protein STEG23_033971 [Scotinomys teguina]
MACQSSDDQTVSYIVHTAIDILDLGLTDISVILKDMVQRISDFDKQVSDGVEDQVVNSFPCYQIQKRNSQKRFSVAGFMLRSLIYLDMSFVHGDRYGSICNLLHVDIQCLIPSFQFEFKLYKLHKKMIAGYNCSDEYLYRHTSTGESSQEYFRMRGRRAIKRDEHVHLI